MAVGQCPIWKTPADIETATGDGLVVNSPRAGGKYWISGSAELGVVSLTDDQKLKLTTWLCDQRAAGIEVPRTDTAILSFIKARKLLPVSRRMAKALLLMSDLRIGHWLKYEDSDPDHVARDIAKTESTNANELAALFKLLENAGYINYDRTSSSLRVVPTTRGWSEIEKLTVTATDYSQAFVAMWFDPAMNEAYSVGIEPAVRANGYRALRIDNKEHVNKIDDEIIAEIRRSRFLLADFTCAPKDIRGGVYYEAGFAQGIGIPVIWTCSKRAENDLHFDTRQYAHIMWETPKDLFEKLKNRIGAVLGDGPLPKP